MALPKCIDSIAVTGLDNIIHRASRRSASLRRSSPLSSVVHLLVACLTGHPPSGLQPARAPASLPGSSKLSRLDQPRKHRAYVFSRRRCRCCRQQRHRHLCTTNPNHAHTGCESVGFRFAHLTVRLFGEDLASAFEVQERTVFVVGWMKESTASPTESSDPNEIYACRSLCSPSHRPHLIVTNSELMKSHRVRHRTPHETEN